MKKFSIYLFALMGAFTFEASAEEGFLKSPEVKNIDFNAFDQVQKSFDFMGSKLTLNDFEKLAYHESAKSHRVHPQPIPTPEIFQNPFMAPNNFSQIHFNSYQTDTTTAKGPATRKFQSIQSKLLGPIPFAIAGTIAFNSGGKLITIRSGPHLNADGSTEISNTLLLIDPVDLDVIARRQLPSRPASTSGVSFAGGGYFYVDNFSRVVCITADQQVRIYSTRFDKFKLVRSWDLSEAIDNPDDILNSVLPDSYGNLWFITSLGGVGYVNPANNSIAFHNIRHLHCADRHEINSQSLATDESGGVYVVSDHALYRFTEGGCHGPQLSWRTAYDRGCRIKPGQNQQGSGTAPTLFNDFDGGRFVAIADNADPFFHVNVYDRSTGVLLAQQAVFSKYPLQNSCENSLIANNRSIIVENNYGNVSIESTLGHETTIPGITRIDFDPATGRSCVIWTNYDISIPSAVSQLSTADGLIYTYAKSHQSWFWAALDFASGRVAIKHKENLGKFAEGIFANNFYSGISISPTGAAYVGILGGLSVWLPYECEQ